MADSKISALTDGGNLQGADQVAINRGGTSYRAVALQDGWIDDTAETWSYASGSGGGPATFTIAGVDLTTKYTVGTRIKLTQTTVKYFVVTAVAFSTNTTVTISGGSDYTLANAAISANYHSYAANPQGYPGWFNFTASPTGFTGAFTTNLTRFSVTGRILTLAIQVQGTSNATTQTLSLPFTVSAAAVTNCPTVIGISRDNGANTTGRLFISSTTVLTAGNTPGGGAYTNSGSKGLFGIWAFEI